MVRSLAVALVVALTLTAACRREPDRCVDTVTELSSLEEVSESGLRGADVLGPAEGLHLDTMRYHGPEQSAFVDVDPPESTTELEVEITYDEGGVRFIDSEADYGSSGTLIALVCSDRVEVDADLALRSADGLLDERWPVTLVGVTDDIDPDRTELRIDVDLQMLAGSLEIVAIDPEDPDALRVFLEIEFPWTEPGLPPTMSGSLGGLAEYDGRRTSEARTFTIASW